MKLKLMPVSMLLGLAATVILAAAGAAASGPSEAAGSQAPQSYSWRSGTRSPTASSRPGRRLDRLARRLRRSVRRTTAEALSGHPGRQLRLSRRVHPDVHARTLPLARRRAQAARRVPRHPAAGRPVVPARASGAGQPDHPDAVGQRPRSAVGERQERAQGHRGVRVAFHGDPAAASGRGAERRDHRYRRVEPGGRSTRADPAALPLARHGHRSCGSGVASACRRHARGVQRARERPRPEGSALRAHLRAARAIRIPPLPATARWPTPSWPRRATDEEADTVATRLVAEDGSRAQSRGSRPC